MAKSISMAIIVALTVANLLPAAECAANGGGGEVDDFNDRASKTGGKFSLRCFKPHLAHTFIFPIETVSAIKRPFFIGSRYGRSDYFGNQKQLSIAPRNDKFFLQSRYGKRSPKDSHDLRRSLELTTNNFSEQLDRQEEDVPLVCLFTGVADLYRCRSYGYVSILQLLCDRALSLIP